jgi:hypothetical protein
MIALYTVVHRSTETAVTIKPAAPPAVHPFDFALVGICHAFS